MQDLSFDNQGKHLGEWFFALLLIRPNIGFTDLLFMPKVIVWIATNTEIKIQSLVKQYYLKKV